MVILAQPHSLPLGLGAGHTCDLSVPESHRDPRHPSGRHESWAGRPGLPCSPAPPPGAPPTPQGPERSCPCLCSHQIQVPLLRGRHGHPAPGDEACVQNSHQRGPPERCVAALALPEEGGCRARTAREDARAAGACPGGRGVPWAPTHGAHSRLGGLVLYLPSWFFLPLPSISLYILSTSESGDRFAAELKPGPLWKGLGRPDWHLPGRSWLGESGPQGSVAAEMWRVGRAPPGGRAAAVALVSHQPVPGQHRGGGICRRATSLPGCVLTLCLLLLFSHPQARLRVLRGNRRLPLLHLREQVPVSVQ